VSFCRWHTVASYKWPLTGALTYCLLCYEGEMKRVWEKEGTDEVSPFC
jgi:hypothetical protein